MKLLFTLFMTVGTVAVAAPLACPTSGTLQDFINFGSQGCTIGRVTISDVTFNPQTATSNPVATDILVNTVAGVLDGPDTLVIQDSDGSFFVGPNQSIHFFIDFNVSGILPGISVFAVNLSGTAAETSNGNNAKVREIVSTYPGLTQLAQMQITQGNSGSTIQRSFAHQATIHVSKEFDLFAQNNVGASASLGPVTQEFFATPEPGTFILLATGLLLVGRWRAKQSNPPSDTLCSLQSTERS